MMLYPSINGLREKTDSRYTLCILAAKRARDIIDGKPVLTEVQAERPVSLATNEIAEDLITYYRSEEEEENAAETVLAAVEAVESDEEAAEAEEAETEDEEEEVAAEEEE